MIALVNQSPDKRSVKSIFAEFCHRTTNETQEIAHNLLGEKFVGQIDVLRQTMQNVLNTEFVEDVSHRSQKSRRRFYIQSHNLFII